MAKAKKPKNRSRRKSGIMGRSDIPFAQRVTTALLLPRLEPGRRASLMPENKQTYGDYIRSLSDEGLAVFLNATVDCDYCIHGGTCTYPYDPARCIAGVKEYLGRERKVDDGQEKEEEPGAGEGCAGTDEEGRA